MERTSLQFQRWNRPRLQRWYNFTNALGQDTRESDEQVDEPSAGVDDRDDDNDDDGVPRAPSQAEGEDGAVKVKGPKQTLIQYFHKTCRPLYIIAVSDEAFHQVGGGGAASSSDMDIARLEPQAKPMTWTEPWTAPRNKESLPKGVSIFGQGKGVIVSHNQVSHYEKKLDEFLSGKEDFFSTAMTALEKAGTFRDVCGSLLSIIGMPFTLARLPKDLDKKAVHLFLGQDYQQGWTFANQEG